MAVSVHPNAGLTSATGCKPKTKGDGSKDYWLNACFVTIDVHTVTIMAPSSLMLNGTTALPASGSPSSLTLAPGATGCIVMHGTSGSGAQGSLQADFVVHDTVSGTSASLSAFVSKADVGVDCTAVTGCPDGWC